MSDTKTLTVNEFCSRNVISRGTFYKILRVGRGPRIMKVGSRTLISADAEADWRRDVEKRPILLVVGDAK